MEHVVSVPSNHQSTIRTSLYQPTDAEIYAMWIHGRPKSTQRAYSEGVKRLSSFVGPKPLREMTLQDLQNFADDIAHLSAASQSRILSTIKSLFSFAYDEGFIPVNTAKRLKVPKRKDTLAERILSEAEVHRMIAREENPRNALILKLLYASGARVSELCALKWRDCTENGDAGQITILGKGGKTRHVRLPVSVWQDLMAACKGTYGLDEPVFVSRKKGGHLDPSQVHRIVKKAAERAGIDRNVSCHWLRHSHATHSLERGAPIHLVMATLGHADASTTTRYLHARPDDSSAMYLSL